MSQSNSSLNCLFIARRTTVHYAVIFPLEGSSGEPKGGWGPVQVAGAVCGAPMCEAYFLLGQNELNARRSHLSHTRATLKGGKKITAPSQELMSYLYYNFTEMCTNIKVGRNPYPFSSVQQEKLRQCADGIPTKLPNKKTQNNTINLM